MMPTKDTALINSMLSVIVTELTKRFPNEIDFILLFGSAARGEFRAGISDVDLVIQTKNDNSVREIGSFAESIFWRLDKQYKTGLENVCSTKRDDLFALFEKEVRLYKPFEVIGPNDIDWKAGEVRGRALGAFAAIAPINQFAKKIKKEGKILYGRDILRDITIHENISDKLRSFFVPIILSVIAAGLSPLMPKRALRYSIKAVLYGIDNQISFAGKGYTKNTSLNLMILRYEIGELYSVRLAREALAAKYDFEGIVKGWSYIDKVAFCLQAPVYISYNSIAGFFGWINKRG